LINRLASLFGIKVNLHSGYPFSPPPLLSSISSDCLLY